MAGEMSLPLYDGFTISSFTARFSIQYSESAPSGGLFAAMALVSGHADARSRPAGAIETGKDGGLRTGRVRCVTETMRSEAAALFALLVLGVCDAREECAAREGSDACDQPSAGMPRRVSSSPRVYVIDDLFSTAECEKLIVTAQANGMRDAGIMSGKGEQKAKGDTRVSLTTTLGVHGRHGAKGDATLAMWRERMADAAMMPVANAEALAVTQYVGGKGHKYELHFDSALKVGRVATVLVFLTDVQQGGELMFPWAEAAGARTGRAAESLDGVTGRGRPLSELEGVSKEPPIAPMCTSPADPALKIAPRRGRAVVFFTHAPDLRRHGYDAMHAGCPPLRAGEDKWIAQLFIKWHEIDEPNLVARAMDVLNDNWQMPLLGGPP